MRSTLNNEQLIWIKTGFTIQSYKHNEQNILQKIKFWEKIPNIIILYRIS